jgi:hypothetical protein
MDVAIYPSSRLRKSPDGSCFSTRNAHPRTEDLFALPVQTSDLFNSAKIALACPPILTAVVLVSSASRTT